MSISNSSICRMLGIKIPILSAPMGNVAGAELAQAVTDAGALGFIGGGYCNAAWIKQQLAQTKAHEFGIGFITWRLQQQPELLALALQYQPRAIFLSFGDIKPFVTTIKNANIPLICQVQTLAQAKQAIADDVDIIVAQGSESGGHGMQRGTMALVPAVVDVAKTIPVLAAGGIADARGIAASFCLGAAGVVMGTRFYAAKESLTSVTFKQKLIEHSGDDTIRTRAFDFAAGFHWPGTYTGRAIKNRLTEKWHDRIDTNTDFDSELVAAYQSACANGDHEYAGIFAGECLDLIHDIKSAKDIIAELAKQLNAGG